MKATTQPQQLEQVQDKEKCDRCQEPFAQNDLQPFEKNQYCPGCYEMIESYISGETKGQESEEGFVSERHLELAARVGTEEQATSLIEKAKQQKLKAKEVLGERAIQHFQNVRNPKIEEAKGVEQDTAKALNFLAHRIGRLNKKPAEITVEYIKPIFWDYFRSLVKSETGIENPTLSKSEAKFVGNFVHWLIGSGFGDWDPAKSLYIWSSLGTGKSTLALAGHHLMAYLRHEFGWEQRYFDFAQMDEIWVDSYTQSDLTIYAKLARGGWCIDELREDHFTLKHYGNELSPIANILSARHSIWKASGIQTVITSNIPFPMLREKINDERLHSRIQQQYIDCFLHGENKRLINEPSP